MKKIFYFWRGGILYFEYEEENVGEKDELFWYFGILIYWAFGELGFIK